KAMLFSYLEGGYIAATRRIERAPRSAQGPAARRELRRGPHQRGDALRASDDRDRGHANKQAMIDYPRDRANSRAQHRSVGNAAAPAVENQVSFVGMKRPVWSLAQRGHAAKLAQPPLGQGAAKRDHLDRQRGASAQLPHELGVVGNHDEAFR